MKREEGRTLRGGSETGEGEEDEEGKKAEVKRGEGGRR